MIAHQNNYICKSNIGCGLEQSMLILFFYLSKKSKMKILMICAGNICRSPLAHGILEQKIKENKLDWEVDSAGTHGFHAGELPDRRSIDIAQKKGLDITNQRSRKIRSVDVELFDVLYCMDAENYNNVLQYCHDEKEKQKVQLIMNEVYPHQNRIVPDPYYGGANGFYEVYEMLDMACEAIVKKHKSV